MDTRNKRSINKEKLYKAAQLIIEALGENPKREGLVRTPERIARDWPEMFDGYGKTPEEVTFAISFPETLKPITSLAFKTTEAFA